MGSWFSYVVPGVERPSLHLPWAVQNKKHALEVECDSVLNSQSQAYIRSTFYYFMIWSSTKQWEILLAVISKSCLRWYNLYWEVLKLRKSVTNHWVHGSPGFVSRSGRVWENPALWKSCGTLHVWGSSYGSCLYQKLRPFWEVKLAGISSILATKMSVAIATIAEFLKRFLGVVLIYD